jgi:predicted phosphodiesterase
VLADIEERGGVDQHWLLGDYVAIGSDPVGVLERLLTLPNATFVRGNTDRYTVSGDRPWPRPADVGAHPELGQRFEEVERSFAWTALRVARAGRSNWLSALPVEERHVLPDGTRVLLVHASPGTDDGEGLHPNLSPEVRTAQISGCDADLIGVGHTHWSGRLDIDGVDIVAVGSVSNPHPPDLRASYATIEATSDRYAVTHRRVTYDLAAAIAATEASGHPAADWINSHFRGERIPAWAH